MGAQQAAHSRSFRPEAVPDGVSCMNEYIYSAQQFINKTRQNHGSTAEEEEKMDILNRTLQKHYGYTAKQIYDKAHVYRQYQNPFSSEELIFYNKHPCYHEWESKEGEPAHVAYNSASIHLKSPPPSTPELTIKTYLEAKSAFENEKENVQQLIRNHLLQLSMKKYLFDHWQLTETDIVNPEEQHPAQFDTPQSTPRRRLQSTSANNENESSPSSQCRIKPYQWIMTICLITAWIFH